MYQTITHLVTPHTARLTRCPCYHLLPISEECEVAEQLQPEVQQSAPSHAVGVHFGMDGAELGQEAHLHEEVGLAAGEGRGRRGECNTFLMILRHSAAIARFESKLNDAVMP